MKYIIKILFITSFSFLVACTANKTSINNDGDIHVDIVAEFTAARKPLFSPILNVLDEEKPFMSTSFVNINDLRVSSTFGRMAAEIISTGLTQRGYKVKEIKMRDNLFIQQQSGEFILSRQLRKISDSIDAQAVLLGTYAIGGKYIYVNARVVRTTDNVILSAYNFSMPINKDIVFLLSK